MNKRAPFSCTMLDSGFHTGLGPSSAGALSVAVTIGSRRNDECFVWFTKPSPAPYFRQRALRSINSSDSTYVKAFGCCCLSDRSEWYRNLVLVTRRNKFAMGAFVVGAGVLVPYALTESFMALTNSEGRRKELEEKVRTICMLPNVSITALRADNPGPSRVLLIPLYRCCTTPLCC